MLLLQLGRSQVVRQRFLVSCTVGSNPTAPAIFLDHSFRPIYIGLFYGAFTATFIDAHHAAINLL